MSEFYSKRLNSFGTASIPKLVLQFSVPAIISMCVNALYNIVVDIMWDKESEV